MVNHPNGLIDPLIVATNNPRIQHFLVKAGAFKNPLIHKLLATLNMMPIYRIRDGVRGLDRNHDVFEKCFRILSQEKALMIFPEGSHNKKRTIRPLSKGFTRIIFGAIDKNPELKIQLVPVGLTYQNNGFYPAKVSLCYGKPILANNYYKEPSNQFIAQLKEEISESLRNLSVHIPDDENYENRLQKLVNSNIDFTEVEDVNNYIKNDKLPEPVSRKNPIEILKPVLVLNSLIPWIIWKIIEKNNDEIEFIDTFRFGISAITIPVFYTLQTVLIYIFFNTKIATLYILFSLVLLFLYAKLNTTPAQLHPE